MITTEDKITDLIQAMEYVVEANSEEEAMKLYNDDIDNCTEVNYRRYY